MTIKEIEAGKTERGGWKRTTLAKWGVPWPPPKGWKDKLISGDLISTPEQIGERRRQQKLERKARKIAKRALKARRKLENTKVSTVPQRLSWKKDMARAMRLYPTSTEAKAKPFLSRMGFSHQYLACGYIADFAHEGKKVMVEFDGSVHEQRKDYDRCRDAVLTRAGWTVLRFSNSLLWDDADFVFSQICTALGRS